MHTTRRLAHGAVAACAVVGALALPAAAQAATPAGSSAPPHAVRAGHRAHGTDDRVTEDRDDDGTPDDVADDGDNAHPSGRDRSVDSDAAGAGTHADPDDDGRGPDRTNGGADVPGGSGGVDQADQDRNNGCGNDDDFEDDNEGWCGRNPARRNVGRVAAEGRRPDAADAPTSGDTLVLGASLTRPDRLLTGDVAVATTTVVPPTPTASEPAGSQPFAAAGTGTAVAAAGTGTVVTAAGTGTVVAAAPIGALPRTGGPIALLAAAAMAALGTGSGLLRRTTAE